MSNVTKITALQAPKLVDQLGALRAARAQLDRQVKDAEAQLKNLGLGGYEGELFDATVFSADTNRIDWKAVAAKLAPSRQLIAAHTTKDTVVKLTVTARKPVKAVKAG